MDVGTQRCRQTLQCWARCRCERVVCARRPVRCELYTDVSTPDDRIVGRVEWQLIRRSLRCAWRAMSRHYSIDDINADIYTLRWRSSYLSTEAAQHMHISALIDNAHSYHGSLVYARSWWAYLRHLSMNDWRRSLYTATGKHASLLLA